MRNRSRPTIVDVARIAGVSPTTVSYVLSGPKERAARISEDTTSRILDVVNEVGYVPNRSARTLRLQRTNHVFFLASRITSLYSQIIARSVEDGLARNGLSLSVHIGTGADHVQRALNVLYQGQADGLIVETDDEVVPQLKVAAADGHAIVAIGPTSAEASFDVMSNDDAPAIREAMCHVVEREYQHFVLMSIRPEEPREHRVRVAHHQLSLMGVSNADISVIWCPHDRIGAFETMLDLLPQLARRVAIYAGADLSAVGVLWACQRLGLDIPGDVAVIGHGNTPETRISVPALTSFGPVTNDFSKAADLMASRLNDRSLPGRHVTQPCQLFIRESS